MIAKGCCRSHPHERMNGYCNLKTEIARLNNENARMGAALGRAEKFIANLPTDEQLDTEMLDGDTGRAVWAACRAVLATR